MDAKVINDYLKRWGKNPHNEPIMKLVWSEDARELRAGEFNEYYGHIFLRTVKGVKEVPKYSWIKERWILERWFGPDAGGYSAELPLSTHGSYEPIYVFESAKGVALPLNLRVVELICSAMFNAPPTKQQIHDALIEHLETEDRVMQDYFEDALELSVLSNQLHQKEAIVRP